MKKILLIIILTLLFVSLDYSQSLPDDKKLVGVFKPVYYEDIYNSLDNLLLKLGNEIIPEKNYLAINICSNEPLPIAYALAKGIPQYVIKNLTRYNPSLEFNPPKIVILRNIKNCEIRKNAEFLTEYWVIENNSEDIKSVESESAQNLFISEITTDSESRQKILKCLRNNKNSWIVIKLKVKDNYLDRRIQDLQRFLTDHKISKNRIFIKKLSSFNEENKLLLVESRAGKNLKTIN